MVGMQAGRATTRPGWILALSGNDPTGGAGAHADARAAAAWGVELRAVATAWTRQDGRFVQAVGAREVSAWEAEAVELVREAPAALKTGLLPGVEHVRAAARVLERARGACGAAFHAVVDPVVAASGGERFLDDRALGALRSELLPMGPIATPNLPEAAAVAEVAERDLVEDLDARLEAAHRWLRLGAVAVVVKGGHARGDPVLDLVLEAARPPVWLAHSRLPGARLHGSGCRFASHLAAALVRGWDLPEAAEAAGRHVLEELQATDSRAPTTGQPVPLSSGGIAS